MQRKNIKILYDSQIFGMQDYGGISRYFYEISKRIPKINVLFTPFVHNNSYLIERKSGKKDKIFNKFKYRNYIYTVVNIIIGLPRIILGKYDIFHPTYYETYYLPFVKNKKIVLTVHDLVHELYGYKYKQLSKRTIKQKRKLVNRADHIIAVSENTKKDIENVYGVSSNKISVIYHGNSLKRWDSKKRLTLPSRYILFVGQRWMYKNFNNFIIAMAVVIKKHPEYKIVSAGGGNFTDDEIQTINSVGLRDRVIHITFRNDNELAEIYSRATLFVYPSLYEGFGIPILEAFSSKTPIAISDTSCFPEIARDAAIYFDPQKIKSIAKAINTSLEDDKLRNKLVKKGTERLKYFSWEIAEKNTINVYQNIYKK